MLRKTLLITIFSFTLLNCDSDFDQGNCEEGFFEQSDFNGGYFCVPISKKDESNKTIKDSIN